MNREIHEKIIRKSAEKLGIEAVLAQRIAERAVENFMTIAELELDEESGVREVPGPRIVERPRPTPPVPTPAPMQESRSIILPEDPGFHDPIQGRDTEPIRIESLASQPGRATAQYNREYWSCSNLAQFVLTNTPEQIHCHPLGAEDKTITLQRDVLQSPIMKCVKLIYSLPDMQMGGPPSDGQKAQIGLEASVLFFTYDRDQKPDEKLEEVKRNASFTFRAREREIVSHNPIKVGELTLAAVAESADGDSVIAGSAMLARQAKVFGNDLGSGQIARAITNARKS